MFMAHFWIVKNVSSKQKLKVHGIGGFQCTECYYKARKQHVLNEHMNEVHKKLKKFQCEKCDFKTYTKYNLGIHIKGKHDGLRLYCDICNYIATQPNYLTKHKKVKHHTKHKANK